MSDKYRNKYRIASTRLKNWDYGWSAAYFVTICTQDRECYFGHIVNATDVLSTQIMQYSPLGVIADVLWYEIKNHTRNVELGVYQVMPNHIHGIIILKNNDINVDDRNGGNDGNDGNGGNGGNGDNVETRHALSLKQPSPKPSLSESNEQPEKTMAQQRFQNQGKNTLSSIVGAYKSAVTKHANRLGLKHGWQSRFHDHIIRNQKEYDRIGNYISNNPANWDMDKFNNHNDI